MDKLTELNQFVKEFPDNANCYRDRADYFLSRKEYDKAIEDYSKAIERKPNSWKLYFGRAEAMHQKGELDNAIGNYSASINQNINEAIPAWINRSIAYQEKGMAQAALMGFREAVSRCDKPKAYALNHLGVAEIYAGNEKEAISLLTSAIEAAHNAPDLYFNRAIAKEASQDLTGAIVDLEKSLNDTTDLEDYEETKRYIQALKAELEQTVTS